MPFKVVYKGVTLKISYKYFTLSLKNRYVVTILMYLN